MVRTLGDIVEKVREKRNSLVVAGGNAPTVIDAIARGVREGIVDATLVGEEEEIIRLLEAHGIDSRLWKIMDEKEDAAMASRSVELVRMGQANILMKGLISTADYTRAILHKKSGLVKNGGLLTHVTVIQVPTYHKLLIVSDVAIIIHPDLSQKIAMLQSCVEIARALEIPRPKVAIISCVEKPSFKIDSTVEASIIKKMANRGQIVGVEVDGPLAIDLAVSKRCAEEKKFESSVAGDSDILIFPDICSANVFFKTLTNLADARIAAVVVGASVPCILTSRADTQESKFFSIALAALLSKQDRREDDKKRRER